MEGHHVDVAPALSQRHALINCYCHSAHWINSTATIPFNTLLIVLIL